MYMSVAMFTGVVPRFAAAVVPLLYGGTLLKFRGSVS